MLDYNKSINLLIMEMLLFFFAHVAYARYFCTRAALYAVTKWVIFFTVAVVLIRFFVKQKERQMTLLAFVPFFATHMIGQNTGTLAYGFMIYLTVDIMFCLLLEPKINMMFVVGTNISFIVSLCLDYDMVVENIPLEYFWMVVLCTNIGTTMLAFISKSYRKKMEENERQNYQLKAAQKSKDEFLANMSHEIRTPMNSVCGMTELILRDETLTEESRDYALNIKSAGQSLLNIINDILDFSKIKTGNMKVVEETYHFHSLLNDVIVLAMARKGNKDLEILVDCDPKIPTQLIGDELRIKQVILNLITNAIKFTNEGAVMLKITQRRTEQGINMTVSIKDTGIGIREEDMDKIYRSFQQLDTKKNRNVEGTGLGLAISKRIITQMDGFIQVQSTYGKGSEFRFTIPQKIYEDKPSIQVENVQSVQAITYICWDDFKDERVVQWYKELFENLEYRLKIDRESCETIEELKDKLERPGGKRKVLFITKSAYKEHSSYFDELAKREEVIAVMEPGEHPNEGSLVKTLYKPFCVLSVANAMNQSKKQSISPNQLVRETFIAPQAKALIVDDNPMNLKVTKGLLGPCQIQTAFAESGVEALNKVTMERYDIIFMDHMMPGMDGVEATALIRKKGGWCKDVPIIALTANAVEGVREMFLASGFHDFVAKPVETGQLERVLKKWLPAEYIIRNENVVAKVQKKDKFLEDMEFSGIDTKQAMQYFAGVERNYIEALEVYLELGETNRSDLEQYKKEENWKEYTIKVHSLKGSSKTIGAIQLAEKAAELEAAGGREDAAYIRADHPALMEMYERVLREIEKNLRKRKELKSSCKKKIPKEQKEQIIHTMETALNKMDMDEVLRQIENLKEYEAELWGLKKAAEQFDFEETKKQLEKWKEREV